MTEEQKDIITIDGTEYEFDTLEDKQKYIVNQIRDLNVKVAQAQFSIDQLRTAQDAFTNMLVSSVKEESVDTNQDNA
jgi:uncharacterized coiled-coil protein SlyX